MFEFFSQHTNAPGRVNQKNQLRASGVKAGYRNLGFVQNEFGFVRQVLRQKREMPDQV